MKLTDFCIMFGMILVALFATNDLKIKAANQTQMSTLLLNKNMDEIVVDGLYAGFIGVDSDGSKEVDLDRAVNHMLEEMSILFYGKNNMNNFAEKYIKGLIYVDESGYYLYDGGEWHNKVTFDEDLPHSNRVDIISKIIEDRTGETTLIAYNDGESYKNTIDDNTLIIVYCGYNFITSEFVYKNSYISAACIKEKE